MEQTPWWVGAFTLAKTLRAQYTQLVDPRDLPRRRVQAITASLG